MGGCIISGKCDVTFELKRVASAELSFAATLVLQMM